MRYLKLVAAFFALLVVAPITAEAAGPGLSGAVKTPLTLDEATLTALPATTVEVKYKTNGGSAADSYTGVLLWDLLKKAELVNDDGKNATLKHTLLITANNGYAVAVALAEFDPDYGNKQVLLAYKGTEDRASFEHLKLIVPGDLRGGRSVRDIASIEVK